MKKQHWITLVACVMAAVVFMGSLLQNMFSNIGGKIKATAKVSCWILIVLFVIAGIALMASRAVLAGLITMIAGALSAWVSSFVFYGFGELVENSCIQTNLMIKQDQR